ncbi:TMhelix containing protein [Vibrio phage 1.244.A._10N.261.54.C3]|nr:TMhelix containing protein [Vibrio phage 1.244.A._10N.261.54.C3]AUR98734.1 TMhelix containing protein [Vibrio phage 1.255.O._10N.286.45.F1]
MDNIYQFVIAYKMLRFILSFLAPVLVGYLTLKIHKSVEADPYGAGFAGILCVSVMGF